MRNIEAQRSRIGPGQAAGRRHPQHAGCCPASSGMPEAVIIIFILTRRELRRVDMYVFALGFKSFVLFGMISSFSLVRPPSASK